MDKTADPNAFYKTKTSTILNELPHLPNTGLWFNPTGLQAEMSLMSVSYLAGRQDLQQEGDPNQLQSLTHSTVS